MTNIIYIDDEAQKGWGLVLERILSQLFAELTFNTEIDINVGRSNLAKSKYDLILLDLRFGEKDHYHSKIQEFEGYKILQEIRRIDSLNYTTPVIIFTASNKIWNIQSLIEIGADSFYIKEHPDFSLDNEFSQNNYQKLIADIPRLLDIGRKRDLVWTKRKEINRLAKKNISNNNISIRIDEKLRLGFGILNRKETEIEREQLIFNKEILAFIVFWSILEEVSHDFLVCDYSNSPINADIKVKGTGKYLIEDLLKDDGTGVIKIYDVKVGKYYSKNFKTENYPEYLSPEKKMQYFRLQAMQLRLSHKISSLLYFRKNKNNEEIKNVFLNPLNNYRNEIDFIHSSSNAVFNKTIKSNQDSTTGFNKCIKMLDFLIEILN